MSAAALSPIRQRLRRRVELAHAALPAGCPEYTYHLVHESGDGLWYVICRIAATGQTIRCGYYQRPADDRVPVIAERLFQLRRRDGAA